MQHAGAMGTGTPLDQRLVECVCLVCQLVVFLCVVPWPDPSVGIGAAKPRRERRLRGFWHHECMVVLTAVAAAGIESVAQTVRRRDWWTHTR